MARKSDGLICRSTNDMRGDEARVNKMVGGIATTYSFVKRSIILKVVVNMNKKFSVFT